MSSASGLIPMPVSRMCTRTKPCSLLSASSAMRPPRSVYLAALFSTFAIACDRRSTSASSTSGRSGSATTSSWPAAEITGLLVSIARSTTRCSSTGSLRSGIAPRVSCETSSRSSSRSAMCSTWRAITSTPGSASEPGSSRL